MCIFAGRHRLLRCPVPNLKIGIDMSTTMIWIVMIVVMVLSMVIQARVKSRFDKYSAVPVSMTGAEVANRMLLAHGIRDVNIVSVEGSLTDHYNPETKTVNLSGDVYYGRSVAAAAISAHECGHAVQHATGYAPVKLRSALVPVVSFTNNWVMWVLFAGVLLINVFPSLIWIGIGLFALTTLFSFVTLPVEIDASARAVKWLDSAGIVNYETKPMAVEALRWAAYTYVIAAISSLATLLYYISLGSRRN